VSLFDYELIVGDHEERLLAFGKYAGRAGLIDFLRGLGHSMFPCLQYLLQIPLFSLKKRGFGLQLPFRYPNLELE
jgi:hypothetical protein